MKTVYVSIGIMLGGIGHEKFNIWTQVRREEGDLDGLLEFPGGKIEHGETPLQAMQRELAEEVEIDVSEVPTVLFKMYPYLRKPDLQIALYCYLLDMSAHLPLLADKGKWLEVDYEQSYRPFEGIIPPANRKIIAELAEYLLSMYNLNNKNFKHLLWKSSQA